MMQMASCGTAGRKRMYRLGFDIGGTHIACGIINDETFEIVGKDACAFSAVNLRKNRTVHGGIGKKHCRTVWNGSSAD